MNEYIATLQDEYTKILERDGQKVADSGVARYNAIVVYHQKYREGLISASELVTAIDEIICW